MKHYSIRTEQAYVNWIKRYIFFHNKQHPEDMRKAEIRAFISELASKKSMAASTQTVALSGYPLCLSLLIHFTDHLKRFI